MLKLPSGAAADMADVGGQMTYVELQDSGVPQDR